jgi:uroporphyrinogen decarboxylase
MSDQGPEKGGQGVGADGVSTDGVRALCTEKGSDPISGPTSSGPALSRKPLLEAVARRPTPRRPLWIMRQAGRYLPEYREFRKAHSFKDLAGNAELATVVTLMPLRRFRFDAAIVFADIMSPLPAIGVEFDFDPGPVVAAPIRSAADLERLHAPDREIGPEVLEALKLVRAELDPATALLGFCGAPWTLAAYLVEGRGVKEFPTLRAFAAAEPKLLDRLLAKLSDLMADYLIAQHAAGADAVQIFDSWAGLLSLADWDRLIKPHLLRLLERVGAAGIPRILFLQNAPHLVDAYARLPSEVLATDWRLDLGALQQRYPERAVQGNIDPAILLAGPDATRAAASELLRRVDPTGHIVNLGHGILPTTPIASVEALLEIVQGEAA